MGLHKGGLVSGGGGSSSSLSPGATGTDLTLSSTATALQFISTQASGSDAFRVTTNGARWHIGAGASDYFSSDGTTITTPAPMTIVGTVMTANLINMNGGNFTLDITGGMIATGSRRADLQQNTTGAAAGTAGIAILNADTAAAAVGTRVGCTGAANAATVLLEVAHGCSRTAAGTQRFAVLGGGKIVVPTTDSSGTPGNATINNAAGRSAIAIGAATVTITNSLVTAASIVIISPTVRDATATLPAVTTTGAGSFTVTTVGNATAALIFNWWVVA